MSILIFFMIMLNMIFMASNHPLSMGLILLAQTISIAAFSGMIVSTFWYSYILILVFLGGMLILFIYVASMASNEKFYHSPWMKFLIVASLLLALIIPPYSKINLKSSEMSTYNSSIWLYSSSMTILSTFLIIYLFIVLVAIVKITKWWGGSIRPL